MPGGNWGGGAMRLEILEVYNYGELFDIVTQVLHKALSVDKKESDPKKGLLVTTTECYFDNDDVLLLNSRGYRAELVF